MTDQPTKDPQCAGPFSDAFDCQVHDPRKRDQPPPARTPPVLLTMTESLWLEATRCFIHADRVPAIVIGKLLHEVSAQAVENIRLKAALAIAAMAMDEADKVHEACKNNGCHLLND